MPFLTIKAPILCQKKSKKGLCKDELINFLVFQEPAIFSHLKEINIIIKHTPKTCPTMNHQETSRIDQVHISLNSSYPAIPDQLNPSFDLRISFSKQSSQPAKIDFFNFQKHFTALTREAYTRKKERIVQSINKLWCLLVREPETKFTHSLWETNQPSHVVIHIFRSRKI